MGGLREQILEQDSDGVPHVEAVARGGVRCATKVRLADTARTHRKRQRAGLMNNRTLLTRMLDIDVEGRESWRELARYQRIAAEDVT